jgi:hypothetical protein
LNGRRPVPRLAWLLLPLLAAVLMLAAPAGAVAAGTATLEGTVTLEGGAPGEGVMVCALANEVRVKCATAGAGGSYVLSGLAEGEYVIEFWTSGSINYAWDYYPHTRSYAAAERFTVTEGVREGIDATLEEGGSIGGVVTAATTLLAVLGVEVCVRDLPPEVDKEGRLEGCAKTSSTGEYTILGLPPGEFDVYFYPEGLGMGLLAEAYNERGVGEAPNAVTVAEKAHVPEINALLDPGGQIEGVVRSAATKGPLGGVEVCLSEAAILRRLTCIVTPTGGGYRFFGLATGSYKVVFSPEFADIYGTTPFPTNESQLKTGEWAAFHDALPTQWYSGQPNFAAATPISVTAPETILGIDASFGTAPAPAVTAPVPPAVTPTPKPKPKPLKCKRGFVKRKVHGKPHCFRRHKPRPRRRHHSEAR